MGPTPGPWKVADRFYILMDDDVACEVAKVCDENIDDDMLGQCDADARLIAAAPELLAALRSAVTILSGWECTHKADDGDTETVRLCKAAIAKAEGRSK